MSALASRLRSPGADPAGAWILETIDALTDTDAMVRVVDSAGDVGTGSSLAVDPGGKPAMRRATARPVQAAPP